MKSVRGPLPQRADVVVIGGGVIGCATAAYVAERGLRVVLLEKEDDVAREGSGRSAGHLRIQGRHRSEIPLAIRSHELWSALARRCGFALMRKGNLYVADRESELEELSALVAAARELSLTDVELVTPRRIREIVPSLTGPVAGGLYAARDGHCDPAAAVRAFAELAMEQGALVATSTKVTRISTAAGTVTGVVSERGEVTASTVVLAAGRWAPHLTEALGVTIPVKPVVYTMSETSPLPPLFETSIRGRGFSARQRPDGSIVLSAGLNAVVERRASFYDLKHAGLWAPRYVKHKSVIRVRLDLAQMLREIRTGAVISPALIVTDGGSPSPDRRQVERAYRALAEKIPGVRDARVARFWTGLLDISPDGLPVIDAPARPRGLVILAAMSGHGLGIAPAIGEIAADLVVSGQTSAPIEPFRAGRFSAGEVAMPEAART